jgi:hypothetical protein
MMIDGEKFFQSLLEGETEEVKTLVQEVLDAGESAERVLKEGLIQAMAGQRPFKGGLYIPSSPRCQGHACRHGHPQAHPSQS